MFSTIKFSFLVLVFAVTGCSGEADEAKKLGFSSADEMKSVHQKGWHTKQRCEADRGECSVPVAKNESISSPTSILSSTKNTPEQLKFPLKVKEVGLGRVNAPCTPKQETYVDILEKPVRVQLECTLGRGSDETQIIFSADGQSVVRVLRKQYLTPSDPEPGAIVKSAVKFYGSSESFDEGNWLANYGNAYEISYNGRRASTSMNYRGIGLLIKGYLCADGNWGTERCGSLGTNVIKYDLIDVDGYKRQIEDGKAIQASKQQSQISNQKF